MTKYAVLKIKGTQYKVLEGEEILVAKLGDTKVQADMLLLVEDDKVSIGKPVLKASNLKLKVVKEEKGEKITVFKYKAKSRYRKKAGFRPKYTRLLVEKIS